MNSPDRRIDITLDRVRECYDALPEAEKLALSQKPWMNSVETVFSLRGMERGEEEALGRPAAGLADIYDELVTPGEHPIEALVKTLNGMFARCGSSSQLSSHQRSGEIS